MSTFLSMFAASTLATILFAPKNTQNTLNRINERIDGLNGKLDTLLDESAFMKARSCLTEFSPRLIGKPKLSYTHHSIDDIMSAAKDGFDALLDVAQADDNNFITARTIFAKTYGNADWVSAQFANQLADYSQLDTLINNYSIKSLVETEFRYEHALEALVRTYNHYENLGWFQFKKKRVVQEKLFEIQRVLITISNEFVAKASMDLDDNELFILFMLAKERSDLWASVYFAYKKGTCHLYTEDGKYYIIMKTMGCVWSPIPCSLAQIPTQHYPAGWERFINRNRKLLNILLSDKTITRKHFRA